ncbi:conserved hypothetical protein [Beggiatoa sp. PS]|nr:conserved hypothetical protein [Beggiatoa sp. PS]
MATYTLNAGDTLYSLARNNGISLNQLLEINPGLDPNNYHVGQIINVSASNTTPSAPSSTSSTSTKTYTIKAGETLYRIATIHGLSLNQLLEMTPGLDPNNYHVGQTINIPSSTYQESTGAGEYVDPSAYESASEPTILRVAPDSGGSKAPWFDIAKRELERGVREIPGRIHNPRIVEYHQSTTYRATTDEVPWCSSFVNWCMQQAGIKGTKNARAASWLNWGQKLNSPRPGCVVVVKTSSSHHVAFYDSIARNRILLLGGNQSDQVKISRYSKSSLRAYRWPTGY